MPSALLLLAVLVPFAGPGSFDESLAAAQDLLRSGKTGAAVSRLEEIRSKWPKAPEVHLALGAGYLQLGRLEDGEKALRRYLVSEPRSAAGRSLLGLAVLAQGQLAPARAELERALRLDPAQSEAAKALARVHLLEGNAAPASELLARLAAAPDADTETRLLLARSYALGGNLQNAAKVLDRLLDKPRNALEVYIEAARVHFRLGQSEKAAEICERGMQAHPNSMRLEMLYAALPRPVLIRRAEMKFEELRLRGELQAKDLPDLLALSKNLMDIQGARGSGTLEAAERLLSRATQIAPLEAAAWHNLGRCQRLLDKNAEALMSFSKVLTLNPDPQLRTMTLTMTALAEAKLDQTAKADETFRAAMELNRRLNPPMSEAAFEYFQYLTGEARMDDAAKVVAEILRWEPFYGPARLEFAKQLGLREQWGRAVQEAELVLRNNDDKQLLRSAHAFLARAYNNLNRQDKAREHQTWVETHP